MSDDSDDLLRHQSRGHTIEQCGFGVLGPDLRYLHANSSLANVTGCAPEFLRGRSIRETQEGWVETLEPLIRGVIDTGRTVQEFVLGPAGVEAGSVEPLWKGHLSTVKDSMGVVLAIALVVEPLAGESRLHSSSVSNDCYWDFYGPLEMLAHEYRNRLAPILSAAQMLQRYGAEKPEILDWAGTSIERQVREMTEELNDLINLAQLKHGEVELHMQEVDIRPLLDRMSDVANGMAADGNVRLHAYLEPQAFVVFGDPARLELALRRLLRYVMKSVRPDSVVELSAELAAGQVVIRIGDVDRSATTGEAVWTCKPFLDRGTSRFTKPGRIGPGLSLAHQIILKHGGTLSGSERGVTVRMPILNAGG